MTRSAGAAERLVIVGAGEHGRVVLELFRALGTEPLGFVEPRAAADDAERVVDGLRILGDLETNRAWRDSATDFVAALGDNGARRGAFARCLALGLRPATAIHPRAIVLGGATVDPGAMVCAGAVVGVGASVGLNAIVNTGATLDHDDRIAAHAHVAPGAHLGGRVSVEEGAFIGIGAAVRDGCRIGAWSLVAGGAMVIGDVAEHARVAGVPARAMMEP
ncbi:MAG TPA: acetyltransferase [Candidatus Limnocylindrales bacterium]